MKRLRLKRLGFALLFGLALLLGDSAIRLYLVLSAPHLAPLVIPAEAKQLATHLDGDGYWLMDNHQGIMYHVQNGIRFTTGQPLRYSRTLWLYGNSGAFGLYVADADTSASRLQKLLNESGFSWRVVNLAVSGVLVTDEYLRLQHTTIQPGDLVVFDDGALDLGGHCADGRFALVQAICQLSYRLTDANSKDRRTYLATVEAARRFALAKGAGFYHFVQPTPYPDYLRGVPGPHLHVPNEMMMDAWHLTAEGETVEAYQIFDEVTLL